MEKQTLRHKEAERVQYQETFSVRSDKGRQAGKKKMTLDKIRIYMKNYEEYEKK